MPSALDQSRRFCDLPSISGLPPSADIVPTPAPQSKWSDVRVICDGDDPSRGSRHVGYGSNGDKASPTKFDRVSAMPPIATRNGASRRMTLIATNRQYYDLVREDVR